MRADAKLIASALAAALCLAGALPAQAEQPYGGSWNGCYAGVNGAGFFGTYKGRENHPDYSRFGEQKAAAGGFQAGAQAGCNWTSDKFLLGAEGELFAPFRSDAETQTQLFGNNMYRNELTFRQKPGAAVSLRAGFIEGSTLYYAKAGVAYAPTNVRHVYKSGEYPLDNAPGPGQPFVRGENLTSSGVRKGASFVFGAGVEHEVSAQWTVRAEYNALVTPSGRVNANGTTVTFEDETPATPTGTLIDSAPALVSRAKTTSAVLNVFKIGVNRRF